LSASDGHKVSDHLFLFLGCEVEEHFSSIRIEPLTCQRVFKANLGVKTLKCGANSLKRNACPTKSREYKSLSETDERNAGLAQGD